MKISGKIPKWLISAAQKNGHITKIWDEGTATGNGNNDYLHDYWIDLEEGYNIDGIGGWCDSTKRGMLLAIGRITKE